MKAENRTRLTLGFMFLSIVRHLVWMDAQSGLDKRFRHQGNALAIVFQEYGLIGNKR